MKKFEELTTEEMLKVYDANSKLQNDVLHAAVESEDLWTEDYLEPIIKYISSYEIGYCGCYMSGIKNVDKFMQGVEDMQKSYCFLPDADNAYIQKIIKVIDRYNNRVNYSDLIETVIEKAAENVLNKICRVLKENYNAINSEYCKKYFLDYYVDTYITNYRCDYFIDDDYILYQSKMICYK